MSSATHLLRRDLHGLAADLKWSAVELVRIADRLNRAGNDPDAQALYRMIKVFQTEVEKVGSIVDEIDAGHVIRVEPASV